MLKRFFNTPESIYKKMGYYSDQLGIIRRYTREKELWFEHLNNTKTQILNYIASKPKRKIAILGSGWLLDVPLDVISKMFSEVWLFDISHPSEIKSRYKVTNIHFIETDLSGLALEIYNLSKSKRKINSADIDMLKPCFFFDLSEFDVVISCNILDQLDDLLIEYLRRKTLIDSDTEMKLRGFVQDYHIQLLPENKSLVIADTSELLIDQTHSIISEKKLLFISINTLKKITQWIWKFDNSQMYHPSGNTWFTVEVFEK